MDQIKRRYCPVAFLYFIVTRVIIQFEVDSFAFKISCMKKIIGLFLICCSWNLAHAVQPIEGNWLKAFSENFKELPFEKYMFEALQVENGDATRTVFIGKHNQQEQYKYSVVSDSQLKIFFPKTGDKFVATYQVSANTLSLCFQSTCQNYERVQVIPSFESGVHPVPNLEGADITWSDGTDAITKSLDGEWLKGIFPDNFNNIMPGTSFHFSPFSNETEGYYLVSILTYLVGEDPTESRDYASVFKLFYVKDTNSKPISLETSVEPFAMEVGKTQFIEATHNGRLHRFSIQLR